MPSPHVNITCISFTDLIANMQLLPPPPPTPRGGGGGETVTSLFCKAISIAVVCVKITSIRGC